ncbi:MarR family transcriptional regulator [Streptomyces katsurahamanus]|uniref:MarR family transcriptional regulator n=2 Tax=Streptomyces TaxID=1883 RepID=A0A646KQ22_STRJU|nr:MarR family transcriptional regulator [Streptomyces katsurahamanus]MQT04419.1 MarR family transcriptional regulator [Streptomyces jumonjinensis]
MDLLIELAETLGAVTRRGVTGRGLTTARAGVLWALLHHGPLTQRALAERLGVTPRNVTGLLDAMEAGELVVRDPHPTDRRATLVSLAEKGRSDTAALLSGRAALAAELFGSMPEAASEAFRAGAETLLARLRAMDPADS